MSLTSCDDGTCIDCTLKKTIGTTLGTCSHGSRESSFTLRLTQLEKFVLTKALRGSQNFDPDEAAAMAEVLRRLGING